MVGMKDAESRGQEPCGKDKRRYDIAACVIAVKSFPCTNEENPKYWHRRCVLAELNGLIGSWVLQR